jgi:hypothetical protein
VRPFTYSHYNAVANYTHYNQPLAHPLGANFQEWIAMFRYQPAPKLYFNGRVVYFTQGLDSLGRNFGQNIFKDYRTRARETGFDIGSGMKVNCLNANFIASYELKENIFFELTGLHRRYKINNVAPGQQNTTVVSVGLRMNMHRREYDF